MPYDNGFQPLKKEVPRKGFRPKPPGDARPMPRKRQDATIMPVRGGSSKKPPRQDATIMPVRGGGGKTPPPNNLTGFKPRQGFERRPPGFEPRREFSKTSPQQAALRSAFQRYSGGGGGEFKKRG